MKNLIILLLSAILIVISGCNETTVQSHWYNGNIVIDGNKTDWGNNLIYNDKENFLYGVQNDGSNLYVCFATNDPDLEAKIIRMGLTVWFDRTGNDDENFGIKYPLNFQEMNFGGMNFKRDNTAESQMRTRGTDDAPISADRLKETLRRKENDLEIVGKNKDDVTKMTIAELRGIEIKMDFQENTLVYELKIPLKFSSGVSYALNADTSNTISIGLETGTIDLTKIRGRNNNRGSDEGGSMGSDNSGGDESAGDMSASGEGGGERSNRRRGSYQGGANLPSPFNFWAEVKLASGK